MRRALLLGLVLVALAASGCKTAVGNYFANRGRDFGECFKVQAGLMAGLGASARLAGAADIGWLAGGAPRGTSAGWVYGDGYAFGLGLEGSTGSGYWPATTLGVLGHGVPDMGGWWHYDSWIVKPNIDDKRLKGARDFELEHRCAMLLPAAFSQVKAGHDWYWMWSSEALRHAPKAHIHAFDVEVTVWALFVGASVGFSPGQFADFLLGWFGLDIAGDDSAWPPLAEK